MTQKLLSYYLNDPLLSRPIKIYPGREEGTIRVVKIMPEHNIENTCEGVIFSSVSPSENEDTI